MSYGKEETKKLQEQIESQLERLLDQLRDLEECKDDLDEEEYESTKKDTLAQMEEFRKTLEKMTSGDMSLIDLKGRVQLAMQATVSNAFKTPEVIALFAKKRPQQLRQRLESLQRDFKLGKISRDAFVQQAVEILSALKELGEKLSSTESAFLTQNITKELKNFVAASEEITQQKTILSQANTEIQKAQK